MSGWGRGCRSGVSERNSWEVLPPLHLSKQLIKPEITRQGQQCRRAGFEPESGAVRRSAQETNRRLPRLSGVTVAPAAVIVLLNRRRKRPIRPEQKTIWGELLFLGRRGGAEVRRGGGTEGGTNRGGKDEGVEGMQEVLGLYLLPLPLSRCSSYLRWSRSWLNFRCWPRSPGGASSARSARSPSLTTPPYRPGSGRHTDSGSIQTHWGWTQLLNWSKQACSVNN